ncbi:MAG: hypothetical protein NTW86_06085 [Candidatus Sumerlaeota bacterium]|nr:hypothetical protein [Candidatus Sumerlaeota bacterium]
MRVSDRQGRKSQRQSYRDFGLTPNHWLHLQGLAACGGDLYAKAKDVIPGRTRMASSRLNRALDRIFGQRLKDRAIDKGKARFRVVELTEERQEAEDSEMTKLIRDQERKALEEGQTL